MRRWPAVGLLLLVVACGGGGPADLSASAAAALSGDVARVSTAAQAHDVSGLRTALAGLRADVARQQASGDLSAARASAVLAAATRVASDVAVTPAAVRPPVPVPTQPAVRRTTAPPRPGKGKKKGDGGDHGD